MLSVSKRCLYWAFALALLQMGLTPQPVTSQTSDRPNILLIVADDMGFSDIGSFGGEIATPALDELAQVGLKLINFHVLPSCSPTRSVLLSGIDNHLAGLGTMNEFKTPEMDGIPGYAGNLNFEVAALPEVMQANGYQTYMVGKWHLGDTEQTIPSARGFDETFALMGGGGSHWADRKPVSPTETMVYRRNGQIVETLPEDFYASEYYTDQILDWFRRDQDNESPFFAYLAYTAPHDPLHAPQEYIDKYKGVYDDGWSVLAKTRLDRLIELGIVPKGTIGYPKLPTVENWQELSAEERANAARDMEVYAAMIDHLDGQISRVIDYLKETGEYDNTLILFMSDNGANGAPRTAYPNQTDEFLSTFDNSLENRGLPNSYVEMGPGWAQASMAPSRMFKAFTAEGGIRAPLLVKLPGNMTNAGGTGDAFLHVRDIMPTILDLAQIAPVGTQFDGRQVRPMQGSSVLEYLSGNAEAPPPEVSQVGYELFGMKAYFSGNWKILLMPKPYGTGKWELFDLKIDPGELLDLSLRHPLRRKQMIARWEQYRDDNSVLDVSLDVTDKLK